MTTIRSVVMVSTRLGVGRGGISTALGNLFRTREFGQAQVRHIESHVDGSGMRSFLSALRAIVVQGNPSVLFWLHCGPWASMARKLILAIVAKATGAQVVFHFHAPTLHDYIERLLGRSALRVFFWIADGIIVLTPWWRERLRRVVSESYPIWVVPNGLDESWLRLADKPARPSSDSVGLTVVAMGRLIPEKGYAQLISAMGHLSDRYRLVIAGAGPMHGDLMAQIEREGLADRVELVGWLDEAQKKRLLLGADVYCLPSRYDSFGMGYIEAMAAGLPVVALNRQAIPDVVPDGQAGFLLDDDRPESIAIAIEQCTASREHMGRIGQRLVSTKYDAEVIAARLLEVITELEMRQSGRRSTSP